MGLWHWIQDGCSLEMISAGPPEALETATAGIVIFERFDETVENAVRTAARAGLRVLAVMAGDALPVAAATWKLLAAGAGDVLHAGDPDLQERMASRLARWEEVEALARDAARKLVGRSAAWRRLLREAAEVARFTDLPILVLGETGTGKEMISQAIHDLDGRSGKRALVTVDCTNLAPELSGSELFGHEKGAFTGAINSRDGAVALAHKGTLFLDEVGELPLGLQAQLLRVLQEKSYRRVGGNVWHQSDFRLICATNRDLAAEVQAGRFRSDLYFRIASWVFRTPPLRERREDILPLARHFLSQVPSAAPIAGMDPVVEQLLESGDYPGNVRELRQLVLRMGQRHTGPGPITPGELPADEWPDTLLRRAWPEEDNAFGEAIGRALDAGIGLQEISNAAKDVAIRLAVAREDGNLQRAAKRLGVTDRALQIRRAAGA